MKLSTLSALCAAFTVGVVLSLPVYAAIPEGYYNSLNGKCGAELMHAVRDLCIDHNEINYSSGTWDAFRATDVRTINGIDYWWDMYSNNLVTVSSGHPGLNVEHSVANSWWGGTKNAAYKDIVHLNPSDSEANSRKSNYPICELSEVKWENGVTFVGTPKGGQGGGSSWGYEPEDQYKGDFARVFMYMFSVYEDLNWKYTWMIDKSTGTMFRSWASELVMRWHSADPVSDKERNRNDGVYLKQGNRNPFIDLPDLADHIWGTKKAEPYGGGSPVTPPSGNASEYSWLSSTASGLDSDWTIEDITLSAPLDYVFSWKIVNGNGFLNASAYMSDTPHASEAYAWSPAIDMANVTSATLTFQHAAKFQTNCKNTCMVAVKKVESGEISTLPISNWPQAGTWNFQSAGTFDLTPFAGEEIRVGLRYASTDTQADTWEINNMTLKLQRQASGIEITESDSHDDSCLVEVWGRNIAAPEGALIFDMNGRQVGALNLEPGIYFVAKPTFRETVKVLVR